LKYEALLLDCFNLVHKLHDRQESPAVVGPKAIYPELVSASIEKIKDLTTRFSVEGGRTYLLFDYFSPSSAVKKPFKNFSGRKQVSENYKSSRTMASQEFMNSLAIIRYYFLAQTANYITIQVQNREADDLVAPVLTYLEPGVRALLVTNDSDWTRYLSSTVHYLPHLDGEPRTPNDFLEEHGYVPTVNTVTIFKAIFGDAADDIPKLLVNNPSNFEDFKEILRVFGAIAPEALLDLSHHTAHCQTYKVIAAIKGDQSQYRINLQLICAQPLTEAHLRQRVCPGRGSEVITSSVEIALGAKCKPKRPFAFGSIFVQQSEV